MSRKFLVALALGTMFVLSVGVGGSQPDWDRSSLEFISAGWDCLGSQAQIWAVVQNSGDGNMTGSVPWELQCDSHHQPNKNFPGPIVDSGTIPALASGQSFTIFSTPLLTEPVYCAFRAEQRPGHPGSGEIWIEVGLVDCPWCQPQPEICDGQDNDCDGLIDEDFPLLNQACSIGDEKCGGIGIYICTPDGSGVECNALPKPDGTSCEDGLFCNGEEVCQAGSCTPGIPPAIDDGVNCTIDSCEESSDTIIHEPSDNLCPADEINWTGQTRWEPDEVRPDGLVCSEKELAERQIIEWFCHSAQDCTQKTPYFEWLETGRTRPVDNDGDGLPNCEDSYPDWPGPLIGDIIINEVAWAGTTASFEDEWIELYNTSIYDYNLKGCELRYRWQKNPERWERILLEGVIEAQDFYLIERDHRTSNISEDLTFPFKLLPDEGTTIYLECFGLPIDIANFEGGPWPAGEITGPRSMERDQPFSDRWHTFRDDEQIIAYDRAGNPILGTPRWFNSVKKD